MDAKESSAAMLPRASTEQIRQLVAEWESYQNDPERFGALLSPDVAIVNVAGRRVLGREALLAIMKKTLETPLAKVQTKHEIEDIRFVRPDVALVSCVKIISDERDDKGGGLPKRAAFTLLAVKDGDVWKVASAQTTPIQTF